jgi:hypothetical protein
MPLTLLDPSLLRISNIDPLGEDLLLTFYGKEGTTYYVESSGDLSTWTKCMRTKRGDEVWD